MILPNRSSGWCITVKTQPTSAAYSTAATARILKKIFILFAENQSAADYRADYSSAEATVGIT